MPVQLYNHFLPNPRPPRHVGWIRRRTLRSSWHNSLWRHGYRQHCPHLTLKSMAFSIFFRSKVVFARLISFRYFGFGCADVPEQPRFEDTFRKRFDHIFKVGTEASIASSLSAPSLSDPRYRIRAHAIGSSQEFDGFTGRLSPSDFCNLMRREQWFPPHFDPRTFGSFTCFRRPGLDQLSFEFSKTAQHCKHQPSGWRCGIRPRVCQGFEEATTVSNLLHDGQQVDCRPPKPVGIMEHSSL